MTCLCTGCVTESSFIRPPGLLYINQQVQVNHQNQPDYSKMHDKIWSNNNWDHLPIVSGLFWSHFSSSKLHKFLIFCMKFAHVMYAASWILRKKGPWEEPFILKMKRNFSDFQYNDGQKTNQPNLFSRKSGNMPSDLCGIRVSV